MRMLRRFFTSGHFGRVLNRLRRLAIGWCGSFAAGAALAKQGRAQSGLLIEQSAGHMRPLH
jgi:hypothetical protein